MDVYFYEAFEEEVAVLRRYLPAGLSAGFSDKTIQETGDWEPNAPLISIRTQSVVPPAWAVKVRGIVSRTTGYDHLVGQKIPCGYLPHYCSRAVAEQALLLVMALLRKLPQQVAQFPTFDRDGLTGQECAGKHLLVVGVGSIGSEVIKIAQALGMETKGVDLVQRHASVSYVSIDEGLKWADIIVCAMNLTDANASYFRYETLKRAKRGVVFVNIARGELSPTDDLVKLLDEGHLGALALDVYENESTLAVALRSGRAGCLCPPPADQKEPVCKLIDRPNVILTPHNAFNTIEAVNRKAEQTIQQIIHFQKHGSFLWVPPKTGQAS